MMDLSHFVFPEVLPPGEGDVHRLSEDSVPAGETCGLPARLPQKLLPLCSLQHKAQVSLPLLRLSIQQEIYCQLVTVEWQITEIGRRISRLLLKQNIFASLHF